jgi:hypothetical protein
VRALGLSLLALGLLPVAGCLVDSQCQADYDCSGSERCDHTTRHCVVECTTAVDCYVNGGYIGKDCVANRCQFRFDERVAAPNFCLKVINPRSSEYGQDFCLGSQRGKVLLLYFIWLT